MLWLLGSQTMQSILSGHRHFSRFHNSSVFDQTTWNKASKQIASSRQPKSLTRVSLVIYLIIRRIHVAVEKKIRNIWNPRIKLRYQQRWVTMIRCVETVTLLSLSARSSTSPDNGKLLTFQKNMCSFLKSFPLQPFCYFYANFFFLGGVAHALFYKNWGL